MTLLQFGNALVSGVITVGIVYFAWNFYEKKTRCPKCCNVGEK